MLIKTCLILLLILSPISANAKHTNGHSIVGDISSVVKNIGLAYLGMFLYSLSHEFGHAIVAKALTGHKINVHIGILPGDIKKDPILKTSFLTIHSLMPAGGCAVIPNSPPISASKNFCISIAGGIFGAVQSYLLLSTIAAYSKYQECKNLKQSLIFGLKNALSPFKNIQLEKGLSKVQLYSRVLLMVLTCSLNIGRLVYSLTPSSTSMINFIPSIDKGSDGTSAWNSMGASLGTQKVVCVISWLAEWAINFFILKNAYNCIKAYPKYQSKP